MAHLTNFFFEFFYEIFTEDASLLLLYHGAKKSKMTKNLNQGGPALTKANNTNNGCKNDINKRTGHYKQGKHKESKIETRHKKDKQNVTMVHNEN